MSRRSMGEGLAVVLCAGGIGIGLFTGAIQIAVRTILPLHLDISWILLGVWILAACGGLAAAALATSARSETRAGRVALGVLGVASFAAAAWSIAAYPADSLSVAFGVPAGLAGLAALAFAVKPRRSELHGGARAVVLALAGLAAVGWGQGTLWDCIEEHRAQVLPARTLELVAAYHYTLDEPPPEAPLLPTVIVDPEGRVGDVIDLEGQRWNVHRSTALRLREVERVRWIDYVGEQVGVVIRVGGETRVALDERARRRSSQYDVLYVDGEPLALVFHIGGEPGRLVVIGSHRARLHAVYRRLTR